MNDLRARINRLECLLPRDKPASKIGAALNKLFDETGVAFPHGDLRLIGLDDPDHGPASASRPSSRSQAP